MAVTKVFTKMHVDDSVISCFRDFTISWHFDFAELILQKLH